MKKLLLISSLVAAAGTLSAFATDPTYAGTVYTVTESTTTTDNKQNDLAYIKLSDGTNTYGPDDWGTIDDYINTSANLNTLQFTSTTIQRNLGTDTKGTIGWTFSSLYLGGVIVDSDTNCSGIALSDTTTSDRNIFLGFAGVTGESTINANFEINNSSSSKAATTTTIAGTQTWTVANGVTYTIKNASTRSIVNNGTLSVAGEGTVALSAGTLSGTGTISVATDSTLDLSEIGKVSLTSAITNSGTVTVGADTVFSLENIALTSDGSSSSYVLVNGGTVTGKTYALSDFTDPTGTGFGSRWQVSQTNGLKIYTTNYTLTWAGAEGATWDATSENFTYNSNSIYFVDGDSVVFNTANASVTVEGSHIVNQLSINAATTFTGTGTIHVDAANLTIADAASLTIDKNATLDLGTIGSTSTKGTLDLSLLGKGTVKIVNGYDGHPTAISLGSSFAGTLDWTGKFNPLAFLNSTPNVSKIILSQSASGDSMWADSTTTAIGADVHFKTNYQIGDTGWTDAGSKGGTYDVAMTFSGNVTAEDGTTVTISTKGNSNRNLAITFSGASTQFSNLTIGQSGDTNPTVNFSAETGTVEINTLSMIAGTVNFSNSSTTIASIDSSSGKLNFSAGTTEIAGMVSLKSASTMTVSGGNLTASQIFVHNTNNNSNDTLNITGGVVNLTGTGTNEASALTISHWPGASNNRLTHGYVNVSGGVLNVLTGNIQVGWNCSAQLNISGGEVNAKTLVIGESTRLWESNGIRLNTLSLTAGRLNIGTGGITSYGTISVNGGTIGALGEWTSAAAMTIGANGATFDTQVRVASDTAASTQGSTGTTITLTGVLSGDGALTKDGAGTLVLGGENTYAGGTTISEGTLKITDASGLGAGAATIAADAELEIALTETDWTTVSNSISGAGTLAVSAGKAIVSGVGSTFTGDITVAASSGLDISNASALELTGTISGSGEFVKSGAGTLTINNSKLATFAGTMTVSAGNLKLSGTSSEGNDVLKENSTLTVKQDAKVTLGTGYSYAAITGDGEVEVSDGTYTFGISGNKNYSNTLSANTVTVDSDATLQFRAWKSYALAVENLYVYGTLKNEGYNKDGAKATDATLSVGDNQTIGGSGTIALATTISGTATIDITDKTYLTFTEGVTFATGAKVSVVDQLSAQSNENAAIAVICANTITFGNTALTTLGDVTDDVKGYFDSSLADCVWTLSQSGSNYVLSMTQAIPEPSMFGLLAGTLALALAGTRRRRKAAK